MLITEIAKHFSTGRFHPLFDAISEYAIWKIIGENEFVGKQAIISNCMRVEKYFKSIVTNFEIHQIIKDGNIVIVSETAEFIKNNQRVTFLQA